MHITLNLDLLRWIDQHKGEKSRAAFIVQVLKDSMQYTMPTGNIHTKGKHEIHNRNGANDAPRQD